MSEHIKVLTQQEINVQGLTVGTEGIVDYVSTMFNKFKHPGLNDVQAGSEVGSLFNNRNAASNVENYLDKMLNDPDWVQARLSDTPRSRKSIFANISNAPEKDPARLLQVLKGPMFTVALDVITKSKQNTDIRKRMFVELKKAKSGEEMDAIYEKNQRMLTTTAVDGQSWMKKGGRNIPAVGAATMQWPVGEDGFYSWPLDQTTTPVLGPTSDNYKQWRKTLEDIVAVYVKAEQAVRNNSLPDYTELDYDTLENSSYENEISDDVCVNMANTDLETNTTPMEFVMFAARGLATDMLLALVVK